MPKKLEDFEFTYAGWYSSLDASDSWEHRIEILRAYQTERLIVAAERNAKALERLGDIANNVATHFMNGDHK